MLKQRVVTGIVCIPVVVAAIWFGMPWFTILVVVCSIIGSMEFYGMTIKKRVSFPAIFGTVWSVLFVISPHFQYDFVTEALIATAILVPLISMLFQRQKEGAFASWAWTIAGIFYVGWLMSHLVGIRNLEYGRNWMFLAIFANFACDTIAFFVGRALGKNKLAPDISPRKTWEGAIGGFFGAIAACFILFPFITLPIGYVGIAVTGVLIGIFAQVGDLVESLLKRNSGVKDASNLLPGHGGILDRLDSIAFTGVVIYYYIVWAIQ